MKKNVCGQHVRSAATPLSLPAGKERHHDNHSQRLKHQLAAANEGSLASTNFLAISPSLLSSFTLVSTLHDLNDK